MPAYDYLRFQPLELLEIVSRALGMGQSVKEAYKTLDEGTGGLFDVSI
jgi:hypothetical protein